MADSAQWSMREGALRLHEMLMSYIEAGVTREEGNR